MANDTSLAVSGSKKRPRQRIGRGIGSGRGRTAGRGQKGAKSRSGSNRRWYAEGGQTPILRRFPKLPGFSNARYRTEFEPVNVSALNGFEDGAEVGPGELIAAGIARRGPIKILGSGSLERKLTVSATRFSAAAIAKIEAAGGSARVIE